MAATVDQAIEQLELDIATLRALITELRPAALDQLGLEPALRALIDRMRAAGLEVDSDVELAYGDTGAPQRGSPASWRPASTDSSRRRSPTRSSTARPRAPALRSPRLTST